MVDHTLSITATSYDKALLWMTKKTVLMIDLTAPKQEFEIYLGFTVVTGG